MRDTRYKSENEFTRHRGSAKNTILILAMILLLLIALLVFLFNFHRL